MQIMWCGSNRELTLPPVNIVLQGWVDSVVINPKGDRHGRHNLSDKQTTWKYLFTFLYL